MTESAKPKSHTVKPGETIEQVADTLGVTVAHLIKKNGLRHELLAHGMVLRA